MLYQPRLFQVVKLTSIYMAFASSYIGVLYTCKVRYDRIDCRTATLIASFSCLFPAPCYAR